MTNQEPGVKTEMEADAEIIARLNRGYKTPGAVLERFLGVEREIASAEQHLARLVAERSHLYRWVLALVEPLGPDACVVHCGSKTAVSLDHGLLHVGPAAWPSDLVDRELAAAPSTIEVEYELNSDQEIAAAAVQRDLDEIFGPTFPRTPPVVATRQASECLDDPCFD